MAFARHSIEKHRLIEMVRVNPILWDCRLPHYKRSDKKKAIKWNDLGRVFGVNGERVQRTFTSLREIFRRELNHEKLLGARFKSKWEYYEAMAFLKYVIRERKSRERAKSESKQMPNSSTGGIDEYQYFAPNDPNNPNNQLQQQQIHPQLQPSIQNQPQPQTQLHPTFVQQPLQDHQINQQQRQSQQQKQQQQLIQLHPEVMLNINADQLQQLQTLSANVLQTQMTQQTPTKPDLLYYGFSGSSSPSIYIKDEPDSQDETISVSTTNKEQLSSQTMGASTTNKEKLSSQTMGVSTKPTTTSTESTTATGTTPAKSTVNCQQVSTTAAHTHRSSISNTKVLKSKYNTCINNNSNNCAYNNSSEIRVGGGTAGGATAAAAEVIEFDCDDDDLDMDADDLDDDADDIDDIMTPAAAADGRLSVATSATLRRRRESPREILYSKFGDFLAARLNTLHEVTANELMNKILVLIAEK